MRREGFCPPPICSASPEFSLRQDGKAARAASTFFFFALETAPPPPSFFFSFSSRCKGGRPCFPSNASFVSFFFLLSEGGSHFSPAAALSEARVARDSPSSFSFLLPLPLCRGNAEFHPISSAPIMFVFPRAPFSIIYLARLQKYPFYFQGFSDPRDLSRPPPFPSFSRDARVTTLFRRLPSSLALPACRQFQRLSLFFSFGNGGRPPFSSPFSFPC